MMPDNSLIEGLWKLRIETYGNRTPRSVMQTVVVPGVLLLLSVANAGINPRAVVSNVLGYLLYLLMVFIVNRVSRRVLLHQRENTYALIVLLRSLSDLGIISMIFVSFWASGVYGLGKIVDPPLVGRRTFSLLILILVMALISSPWLLRAKLARSYTAQYFVAIVAVIIGMACITPLLQGRLVNIDMRSLFFLSLSFMTSLFLLPNLVWAYFEILILGLGKWPEINKPDLE